MRKELILNSNQLPRLLGVTNNVKPDLAIWMRSAPEDKRWRVEIKEYRNDRSYEQNRLQRLWLKEAQKQGDQTAEQYRGHCKLHFGVPIMRRDSEEFQEVYDRLIRPRPYEEKLELMMIPMDMPVTRIMNTKQKAEYLSEMCRFFAGECGFHLTDPGGYL
ncbi:MAG: hypothetical protein KZQ94_16030 [Candidatus Thiodiazotropha sp. (ex Troendleina suluensis)]|nr:hypothetical protein [Candidatus Thiodiazotropha sp. (ex Troendleina suluensis)]